MALPKKPKILIDVYPIKIGTEYMKYGLERIKTLMEATNANTDALPQNISIDDLDLAVFDLINSDELSIVIDGKLVNTYYLENDRWAEFSKTWKFTDGDNNIPTPYITVRRIDKAEGTRLGDVKYLIPQLHRFRYRDIPILDEGQVIFLRFKMPEPVNVDLTHEITLFTKYRVDVNAFDEKILRGFASRQGYVFVKGNPMPVVFNGFEESNLIENLDGDRYYVSRYTTKIMGFLQDENDYEITKTTRAPIIRTNVITDIDHRNVNKNLLIRAKADARSLYVGDYDPESWQLLVLALSLPEITQKEVDDKVIEINNAIANLITLNKNPIYISYPTLYDVFKPTTIRNTARNNFELTNEVRWKVIDINYNTKEITFDRALPEEIIPYNGKNWAVYSRLASSVEIVSVDYANNKITFGNQGNSNIVVNEYVYFFNPYASVDHFNNGEPLLINNNLAPDLYNSITTMWIHTDGRYMTWMLGWVGTQGGIFLAESTDLKTWTGIGSFHKQGVGSFVKPYLSNNSKTMYAGGESIKQPDGSYALACSFQNSSGIWGQFVFFFNEDGNITKLSNTHIPNCNQGGLIVHNNKNYFYTSHIPDTFNGNRVITEYIVSDFESLSIISETSLDYTKGINNVPESPLGSHTDQVIPCIYNDDLYLFVSGTGTSDIDYLHHGNRCYMILKKKSDGTFYFPKNAPHVINPIEGNNFWYKATWASDHLGYAPILFIKDNILYLHLTMSYGKNLYFPTMLYKDLTEL